MTRADALRALLERVDAGECQERGDFRKVFHLTPSIDAAWAAYSEHSLDAAKALHEAVLPGWGFGVTNDDDTHGIAAFVSSPGGGEIGFEASGETPARAWLVAILKALIAQEID